MPRSPILLLGALGLACGAHPAPVRAVKAAASPPSPPTIALATLTPGQEALGFTVEARYLDDAGKPMGARFRHRATGFQLDYLRIDSAPQTFIWVNTFATSDGGEPHTQEHLVLGKGNEGRRVTNLESMSLAKSSAFTDHWRTCYHMNAPVAATFWSVLQADLQGLVHPDYTDEEIRREVRNFGVATGSDGKLRLEEKGTVYNEMVRTFETPEALIWRASYQTLYGADHPLALSAGGWPAAIRALTPEAIRRFHRNHYHLGNMGMIVSLPSSVALDEALRHAGDILDRLGDPGGPVFTEDDLPPPHGAAPGGVDIVEYPNASPTNPSPVFFVWPATNKLALGDKLLLDLFMTTIASDESSDLYKLLIDSKSRVVDIGATGVSGWANDELGAPVYIALDNVAPRALTPERLGQVRARIVAALRRIAELPDGSPALAKFNERVRSRLIDQRRTLVKTTGSPPEFGKRGIGDFWMMHLYRLGRAGGFDRSLTLRPQLEHIDRLLREPKNPWRGALAGWGLLAVQPTIIGARPSPALLERNAREREARIAAETARLERVYGVADAVQALRRYQADYDKKTAELDAIAKQVALPPFTATPPMTLDDLLDGWTSKVGPGVPLSLSSFASMAGAQLAIAFRLHAVPEPDLAYVAILPALLREVGIAGGGEIIPYDEMNERLRREILSLDVGFTTNARTGRVELVVRGSGVDVAEARRALDWMARVLTAPDWRPENLPRLRDVAARYATALRTRMQGAEESWANDPPTAYWRQRSPLYLHAASFLTRAHDADRLRWLLEGGPEAPAVAGYLKRLERAGRLGRARLEQLTAALQKPPAAVPRALRPYLAALAALPPPARARVAQAASDLGELLADLPDASLAADWTYLCREIAADLMRPPGETLAALNRVRSLVVRAGNARMWAAGADATLIELAPAVAAFAGRLDARPVERETYSDRPHILDRVAQRVGHAVAPVFVGLVNRNTSAGLVLNAAPSADYATHDDDELLRYLAGSLYSGHGAHSLFMKTWGAGLAYSNGLRPRLREGRLVYYAERCPRLPQTLRFVDDVLRHSPQDPHLIDYAIAQAFGSRVADTYEARAEGYASDLADRVTPDAVRAQRKRLLALRGRKDLAAAVYQRLESVVGSVLPGYGPRLSTVSGGIYFVVGPESQLSLYDGYLREVEGGATLQRLYPRDFWFAR